MPARSRVFGIDAPRDPLAAKRIIAWVSDEPMVYDRLTPYEYLEFVAGLWQIDAGRRAEKRARELMAGSASRPMPTSAAAAFPRACCRRSRSPAPSSTIRASSSSMNPLPGSTPAPPVRSRTCCCEKVRDGVTVIMTTHILEVAERMAERIGVIDGGRLIAEGTLAELRAQAAGRRPQP